MFVLINQPTHTSKSVVFLCTCWWTKISVSSYSLRILNGSRWRGQQYIHQDGKELRENLWSLFCFVFFSRYYIPGWALVLHQFNQQGQLMSLESAWLKQLLQSNMYHWSELFSENVDHFGTNTPWPVSQTIRVKSPRSVITYADVFTTHIAGGFKPMTWYIVSVRSTRSTSCHDAYITFFCYSRNN